MKPTGSNKLWLPYEAVLYLNCVCDPPLSLSTDTLASRYFQIPKLRVGVRWVGETLTKMHYSKTAVARSIEETLYLFGKRLKVTLPATK